MRKLLMLLALCSSIYSLASVLDLQPDGDDVKRKIDPTAYAAYTTADGKTFELTNRWILSKQADGAEVLNTYFISTSGYNATSVALDGILYVADGALADQAGIDKYDLVSGKYLGTIKLSVDGTPVATGVGGILNVTKDDFGHLIYHGYAITVGLSPTTGAVGALNVYYVTDLETGAAKLAGSLTLPEVEQDRTACRVDYSSVTGDITGTEAHCYVMAVPTNNETLCYRWKLEQGATEWVGDFPDMNGDGVGDVVWTVEDLKTYPAGQALWNTGSYLRIVKDDSYSASLFYIDGNTTLPVLYDTNGNMIDGCAIFDSAQGEVVANIPGEWMPDGSVNGLVEFSIAGKNFVAFATGQHNKFPNDGMRIIEVGENFEWSQDAGAALAWQQVPVAGFGDNVGGGRRITSLDVDVVPAADGKEGVYLSINRLGNGLAVYSIAEQGWVDPNGAVKVIPKSMTVLSTANEEEGFMLDDIHKIVFADNTVDISRKDKSTYSIEYDDLSKMYLSPERTGVEDVKVDISPEESISINYRISDSYVEVNSIDEIAQIAIFNMDGRLVQQIFPRNSVAEFSMSEYPSGIYILKAANATNVVTKKFIKR